MLFCLHRKLLTETLLNCESAVQIEACVGERGGNKAKFRRGVAKAQTLRKDGYTFVVNKL